MALYDVFILYILGIIFCHLEYDNIIEGYALVLKEIY